MKRTVAFVISASLVTVFSMVLLADEPLSPENALKWMPKEYPEATLHARISYLQPQRAWERMDVWVPNSSEQEKLPCVVAVYGGGYGEKGGGFINDARPLLNRGFVVAAPDYALQTDAPVPLCAWDVANAIRYLRANAEKYRIDPERIGIWGWSAGGWIAQDLCYTGPQRFVSRERKIDGERVSCWFPMLQPHPVHAEQSVRLQAVVSDWGAGKLWDRRKMMPQPWLSPDDPPLFTCYNEAYSNDLINPVMLLRRLGVPSRAVYEIQGNTHVPNVKTEAVNEDGSKTTWGDSICDFFERQLKVQDTATAPEMLPHGGAFSGTTEVRLLTVHPTGSIRYTLDGSVPDQSSPRYERPITVSPGQTLRAIVVRDGLKPSRITTGHFSEGPIPPAITTKAAYQAKVGQPFRVQFEADNAESADWFIGGKTGQHYRQFDGQRFNPPSHIPWISIDSKTGVLSGIPRNADVFPVIVSCVSKPAQNKKGPQNGDAILIVVTVEE